MISPIRSGARAHTVEPCNASYIAKAVQDGGTSELDAKLSNQGNATFTPTRAGGRQASFAEG